MTLAQLVFLGMLAATPFESTTRFSFIFHEDGRGDLNVSGAAETIQRLDQDALSALLRCELDGATTHANVLTGACALAQPDAQGIYRGTVDVRTLGQIVSAAGGSSPTVILRLPKAMTRECSEGSAALPLTSLCFSGFGSQDAPLSFAFGASHDDALMAAGWLLALLLSMLLLMRLNISGASKARVDPSLAWSRAVAGVTTFNVALGSVYAATLVALDVDALVRAYVGLSDSMAIAALVYAPYLAATILGSTGLRPLFVRTGSTWTYARALRVVVVRHLFPAATTVGAALLQDVDSLWAPLGVLVALLGLLSLLALLGANLLAGHAGQLLTSGELFDGLSHPGPGQTRAAQRFFWFPSAPSGFVPVPAAAMGTVQLPELLVRSLSRRQLIHAVAILAHARTVGSGIFFILLVVAFTAASIVFRVGGVWGMGAASWVIALPFFMFAIGASRSICLSAAARASATGELGDVVAALRILSTMTTLPMAWRSDGVTGRAHRMIHRLARHHGVEHSTLAVYPAKPLDPFPIPGPVPAPLVLEGRLRVWVVYATMIASSVTVTGLLFWLDLPRFFVVGGAALAGCLSSLLVARAHLQRQLSRDETESARRLVSTGRASDVFVAIAPGTSVRVFDGGRASADVGHIGLSGNTLWFNGLRTSFSVARGQLLDVRIIVERWRRGTLLLRYRLGPKDTPSVMRISTGSMKGAALRFEGLTTLMRQWVETAAEPGDVAESSGSLLGAFQGMSMRRMLSVKVLILDALVFGGLALMLVAPFEFLLFTPPPGFGLWMAGSVGVADALRLASARILVSRGIKTRSLVEPGVPVAGPRV